MNLPSSRLTTREKVSYSLGDTASNIFFHAVNVFIFYFYTDVFMLHPAAAGSLLLVTRLWDAISDPLMGSLSDRTRSRFGVYRPYLLWMAVPAGLAGYLAFANPALGESCKLIYAYVTYILLMTAYTAINVPYSALMGVMSASPEERTSLSTFRFVGAFSGQLLVSLAFLPLVRLLGGGDEGKGFPHTMAILAFLAILFFLLTFAGTRERVKPPKTRSSLANDARLLFKNRPWVIMALAALLTLSSAAIRWTVTPHYYKYYAGADASPYWWFLDRTSFVMTTGTLAFILGVFFTGHLSRRFGKRNSLMALTILNGLSICSFFFIPRDAYLTMVIVNLITNLLAGPTPALVWAIYTDVADFGEWKFGHRMTGLAFSAAMFAQKLGISLGGSLCGWTLALFGFVADQAPSEATLNGLRIIFSLIPGLLAVATGIILLGYKLSHQQMQTVVRELAERREREAEDHA